MKYKLISVLLALALTACGSDGDGKSRLIPIGS